MWCLDPAWPMHDQPVKISRLAADAVTAGGAPAYLL
jgi:hypothetical protein